MTNYYCDSSAIIKLYHRESGTDWMEGVFSDIESTIIISELTLVEIHSAFAKKMRTKEITEHALRQAVLNFKKDCYERFVITPLDIRTITRARDIIDRHGSIFSIRTLDALQLAGCKSLEDGSGLYFVCSDLNLNKICELEGVSILNPEIE